MIRIKLLFFLLYFSFISSHNLGGSSFNESKIIGGRENHIRNAAYQAALEDNWGYFCSACLISDTWLVSAAHCFFQIKQIINNVRVRVGSSVKLRGGDVIFVKRVIMHPDYNHTWLNNDISLIELPKSVEINDDTDPIIGVIGPNYIYEPGTDVKISGWGQKKFRGPTSVRLISAIIKIVENWKCRKAYGISFIASTMFCASARHAATCMGDSGGPAIIKGRLGGVISGNSGCHLSWKPNILTKFSTFFHWVENVTGLVL